MLLATTFHNAAEASNIQASIFFLVHSTEQLNTTVNTLGTLCDCRMGLRSSLFFVLFD